MTPRQARIALVSFLLLAAGVAANALFLQSRPTMASRAVLERPLPRTTADRPRQGVDVTIPAARAGQRTADERMQRAGRLNLDVATIDAGLEAPGEPEDSEIIRAVQRELRLRGYGALVSDGVMRPVTRAAIMAYEHDHGLALTGEASEALLKSVLLGAPSSELPAASRKSASARAEQIVRTVQQRLTALGYQPGSIDGRLGEDTVRAIREFEMDKGLAVKGRISAEVLTRLTDSPAAKSTIAR